MARIILIETSGQLCSVALSDSGKCICSRESDTPRAHASLTAQYVKEVLDEAGISVPDCDAVCVSSGPGSYTGLRVGVSTAKGLCFAAGIPLISMCTLDILVAQARQEGLSQGCQSIVPVIDARRMEVYTAVYGADGKRRSEIQAEIIDSSSFAAELSEGGVLFTGDAAEKCSTVIKNPSARFVQAVPHAAMMALGAEEAFNAGKFENCAYFEPFYLKQFVATTSKKKLF